MAHRAEEKERRRQERIAQEEAARKAAARRRRCRSAAAWCWAWPPSPVVRDRSAGRRRRQQGRLGGQRLRRSPHARPRTPPACTFSQFKSEGRTTSVRQAVNIQDQPAHVGQPPPDAGPGRHLPRRQLAAQGELRPHARARAHRVPVHAGPPRPTWPSCAALCRGALQRHRRLPRAALREQHGHAGQFAATAWTKSITCPTLNAGVARHARLPQRLHRQGPRVHP